MERTPNTNSQTTPRRASVCDLHEQPYATHEQPSHTSRSRREHDATPSPTDSDSEHEPDDAGWTTLEDTSFMEEQNVIVDDEEAPQIDIDETQALHFFASAFSGIMSAFTSTNY
ncbi:hypothetical protein NLI96_g3217 [Meripilus lineatus]|uniref:Uncharacterized protein n=1 Tax=Meripilus lineatus TaxID=2056292 RepID=A0AAD5V9D5_9APHY|nr:hypothetical protein NLI96_g3217 [Physisporinus lineatus]